MTVLTVVTILAAVGISVHSATVREREIRRLRRALDAATTEKEQQ
jgi:hypothetical protein